MHDTPLRPAGRNARCLVVPSLFFFKKKEATSAFESTRPLVGSHLVHGCGAALIFLRKETGCGDLRACLLKRRGTRSEVRREFPLVRTTAFPKLRGTEHLTENERQVGDQQPAADLDRLDRAADGGPCGAGAAADSSHDRHEQRHQQELQQGDIHLAEMRSAFTVLQTSEPKSNPNRSELLDPRIMH